MIQPLIKDLRRAAAQRARRLWSILLLSGSRPKNSRPETAG
jgi:hypothetical protein